MLRTFALTALASLDEAVCHLKLKELITGKGDDELRYGAFRALRELNQDDALVRGELLNDAFWLHRVATEGSPFVHVSTTKRAEVVLFGSAAILRPPFSILAGEFAITSAPGQGTRVVVARWK